MKVLVAAATQAEVKPLLDWLEETKTREVEVLVTGIGMAATAYSLGKYFAKNRPGIAIQAGIAGSFRHERPLGEVLLVTREIFGDLGAEDRGQFTDLFTIGLWQHDMHPFTHHYLINPLTLFPENLQPLPQVTGVTVNTVSGETATIARLEQLYQPDIESMEGAAFHYACLVEGVPFLQLRSVSNYVEIRDKSKWNIPLAVKMLNDTLKETIAGLTSK
ncbi:futalosine hydrolase [Chitinophaga sp. GCM10012297]|uniref:Futalosine hydrolase n=1 Tax=Chitinophaga chungangae TaxID=2821488 RepID=A0ABS3Y7I6_9BACT|nr:futalosine hydrolase [Chitinophaga chungangae]MBO9150632.1 futalosine hydrolase [Chitinophaga chungangae]